MQANDVQMTKIARSKIADIRANPSGSKAFIIADAKDADMAFGITAPGQKRPLNPERVLKSEIRGGHWRNTGADSRSRAAGADRHHALLGLEHRTTRDARTVFENSHITPAARANDATDIWVVRGAGYIQRAVADRSAARPSIISNAGRSIASPAAPHTGADLGLYSVTFTNNLARDYETLQAFKEFREEAERKSFRYFLEVFDPNVDPGIPRRRSMASSTTTSFAAWPG